MVWCVVISFYCFKILLYFGSTQNAVFKNLRAKSTLKIDWSKNKPLFASSCNDFPPCVTDQILVTQKSKTRPDKATEKKKNRTKLCDKNETCMNMEQLKQDKNIASLRGRQIKF